MNHNCPSCGEDSLRIFIYSEDGEKTYFIECANPFTSCIFSHFSGKTKQQALKELADYYTDELIYEKKKINTKQ